MKNLLKILKSITVLVLALSFSGCEEDDVVLPKAVAGFTYTVNIDTGTVTFINISENSNSYQWDFGDGTSSTLINPTKTYENGTYTVVLEANHVSGSSDVFQDEIVILIPEIATIPISFDGANTKYEAEVFGGASFVVVDNPDASGANATNSKVGEITNSGAAWEGFYFDLGAPLNLSELKTIKVLFWSDTPVNVLLKLENGTTADVETTASHGGTGWEELLFNFTSAGSFSRFTMFVDGPGTTSGKFYIDDITQIETPAPPCTEETMQSLSAADLNITFMTDISSSIIEDGADFTWIDNPDFENDVNKSCKVGQIRKLGNNPWDNNQIDLDGKLDFNSNTGLKIKVWSPNANTEVRIKLEEIGNPGNNTEQFLTTSVTAAWEELTFPFTAADSGKFNKIVLFFDLNANNTDTYYFDDLMLYGTGSGGTGGGGGTGGDNLLTNGDFENGITGWIGNAANAVTEGGNTYNFADVTAAGNPYDVNLSQVLEIIPGKSYTLTFDASSDRSRTMIAGIGLNEAPWSSATETVNLTTNTQTFTLELVAKDDNTNADFGIPNSRVLFDMGAAVGVVVIDNVKLVCNDCDGGSGGGGGGGGGGPTGDNLASNGTFETGTDSGWIRFQNGGTAVLDNSISNGGSWSGKLATGGASNPAFKQEAIGAGTVAAGNTVTIKFDHIGSVDGEGGVFNVLLFGEGAGGASFTHVFNPAPVLSGSWSTFTGSFTIPAGTDVSGGISFLIETVCGGAAGCSVSANIDNVSVTLN